VAYLSLSQYEKAIGYFEQALAIAREVGNRAAEGTALNNLGSSYWSLSQNEKAISYHEQALAIAREVGSRASEGMALNNLGEAYLRLSQYDKAVGYLEQALSILRQVGDRDSEGTTLGGLAKIYLSIGQPIDQPRLAIFYGKQAVNVIQSIRGDIRGLDQSSQRTFLDSKKETYRSLADVLVSQGRLLEAQQVLNLLKQQEFSDYVRGDQRATLPSGRADLTSEEAEWAERYRQVGEVLVAKGVEMDELHRLIKTRPEMIDDPSTQKQLEELQKDLQAGNNAFQHYLGDLKQQFAAKAESAPPMELREVEALKADLADLKHGAVAIYTLVTADRYRAILVTPRVQRAYETLIKSDDLNRKILAFREATQDPRSDPHALGKELYNIIIPAALAQDLQQAGAETLMWSLDGPLRYVPIAALYDGQRYLIEKYRVTVFTPASEARLKETPQPNWRGIAFGAAHAKGFPPLPSVPEELAGIIREKPGETGELEGHRFLDDQFTRQAMDRELLLGYAVVHVASHFNFRPGDERQSFLLMGDGGQLSLADLKIADTMFAGVDLLTLSACSTGLGDISKSDGSEVESFGVLAQRKGAKAVVASLWPVADQSTALLMREFYHARQSNLSLTKIDALREAQLKLLRGELTGVSGANSRSLRQPDGGPVNLTDFRHPYFWAPFFLMGNWL
jgi:CHAT domain-containing protein